MKKKSLLIAIAVLIVALGVYTGYRFATRGTDIIGVTTLSDRNMVIMNAKSGNSYVAGSGNLSVAEGERIHLEYDFSAGSIDVAFLPDEEVAGAVEQLDQDRIATAADMLALGAFGKEDVTGKGSLDFDAAAGGYTVYITNHDAVGKAVVTAEK